MAIDVIVDEVERVALIWREFFVVVAQQVPQYVVLQLQEEALQ